MNNLISQLLKENNIIIDYDYIKNSYIKNNYTDDNYEQYLDRINIYIFDRLEQIEKEKNERIKYTIAA